MGDLRDQLKKAKILSDKDAKRLAHEERVHRKEVGREGLELRKRIREIAVEPYAESLLKVCLLHLEVTHEAHDDIFPDFVIVVHPVPRVGGKHAGIESGVVFRQGLCILRVDPSEMTYG